MKKKYILWTSNSPLSLLLSLGITLSACWTPPDTIISNNNKSSTISFDFDNAIALVIDNTKSQNNLSFKVSEDQEENDNILNLKKILSDRTLADAVNSGTVTVKNFMIDENNTVYLLLSNLIDLDNDGVLDCLFVKVKDRKTTSCVDNTIVNPNEIQWEIGTNVPHNTLQIDGEGRLYYLVSKNNKHYIRSNDDNDYNDNDDDDDDDDNDNDYDRNNINNNKITTTSNPNTTTVATTPVITDFTSGATISDYLVLEDGTVLISGTTSSTSASWIRKITPTKLVETIIADSTASFMTKFPDGNIYIGVIGYRQGVVRYIPELNIIDNMNWIGTNDIETGATAHFDCSTLFSTQNAANSCSGLITFIHRTLDDRIFVVSAGNRNNTGGSFMQYYPEVKEIQTSLTSVSVVSSVNSDIILGGRDINKKNIIIFYDTTTGTETDLLNGEEIEAYSIEYISSSNIVIFDGWRFSDNSYILCQVDIGNNNQLTCSNTNTNIFTSIQFFN